MRLLIAEDDEALGHFLKRGFEADGYRVLLAPNGGIASRAFRDEMPDLTILDLNLPVKDGEEVLNEIRALGSDLPVLVLTARTEPIGNGCTSLAVCASRCRRNEGVLTSNVTNGACRETTGGGCYHVPASLCSSSSYGRFRYFGAQ